MTLPDADLRELIGRHLDGLATEAESARLAEAVRRDPAAADALARAARMEAGLAQGLQAEAGAEGLRDLLAGSAAPARHRRRVWLWAGVAAAAAVVLVAGAAWQLVWRSPPVNRVLGGTVVVDGVPVARLDYGRTFEVRGEGPASVRLAGEATASLEPQTAGRLREAEGNLRPGVDLDAGGGTFTVGQAPGRFQVRTPVGAVTAIGTEFTVRLQAGQVQDKGDRTMRATHLLLAVMVTAGIVQVDIDGQHYTLGLGDSRVFAKDNDGGPRLKKVQGEIAKLGGNAIGLVQRGDEGEKTLVITVDPKTQVFIESDQTEEVRGEGGKTVTRPKVVEGALSDLKVGMRIAATCMEDGKAVKILVSRPRPTKREGGEGGGEKPKRPENKPERPRDGEGGGKEGDKRPENKPPRPREGEGER
jgi:ferric-dicitrate binding protein FerR (iron transport regulator)